MKMASLIARILALSLLVATSAAAQASSDEVRTVTRLTQTTNAPIASEGKTDFRIRGSRIDFKVEVSGLPAGAYNLFVDSVLRGSIDVRSDQFGTFGEIEFRNTASPNKVLLDFDPDGATVEIAQPNGDVVFTSVLPDTGSGIGSDDTGFDDSGSGSNGGADDTGFDDSGSGSNSGTDDTGFDDSGSGSNSGADDTGFDDSGSGSSGNTQSEDRIRFDLPSTGVQTGAAGRSELRIRSNKSRFKVRIQRVETGSYDLFVDGEKVGTFQASLNNISSPSVNDDQGGRRASRHLTTVSSSSPSAEGEIDFRDPIGDNPSVHLLTFDPRGKVVEVRRGSVVVLSGLFPTDGNLILTSGSAPATRCDCTSDLNGDGVVDSVDMRILLADFGPLLPTNQPLPGSTTPSGSRRR